MLRLWLALFLLTGIFSCAGYATQGGGRPADRRPPVTPPREPRRPPRRIIRPGAAPSSSRRVSVGSLTITTHPTNCVILLNGRSTGVTGVDGNLRLNSLSPGRHVLTTSRDNYRPDQRTIEIQAEQETTVEVSLVAFPGMLNVTSNVADASINIISIGNFVGQINDLSIAPGVYRVDVSRPGYQTATRSLEVQPGTPANLEISLEPLPVEQALAQAEQSLRNSDYSTVTAICEVVLRAQPSNERATLLTGYSHYYGGRFNQGLSFLLATLEANNQIEIPVRRYQREPSGDNLFSGMLILRRGSLAFQSNERPDFNFSVPADKIYELRTESQKGGRINVRVGIIRGANQRERRERFYLHPSAAFVAMRGRNGVINCASCQEELQAIFQLIQRVS